MGAPRYLPAGESALVVEFGATADRSLHNQVMALDAALAAVEIDGIRECVPTYRSLMIHFDPRCLTPQALIEALGRLDATTRSGGEAAAARRWRIPVCYDPPYAEDLEDVADLLDLAPDKVVALHAEARYRVVMYGFAPGFVFLNGLPKALTLSRRPTPRPPAPPGALTIANGQALIASVAMPTGWYMVGRTPARTFIADRDPPFPIGVGDEIMFQRVDAGRFVELEQQAEAGIDLLVADS